MTNVEDTSKTVRPSDHSPYVFAATVPLFALSAHRAFAGSGRSR